MDIKVANLQGNKSQQRMPLRSSTSLNQLPNSGHDKARAIQARAQQEQIEALQSELLRLAGENRDLQRRIDDLNGVRRTLKEQLEEARHRQRQFLTEAKGVGSAAKVDELISRIERQRDVYKANVERLLVKLDPGRGVFSSSSMTRPFTVHDVILGKKRVDMSSMLNPDVPDIGMELEEEPFSSRHSSSIQQRKPPKSSSTGVDPSVRRLKDIQADSRRVIREREHQAAAADDSETERRSLAQAAEGHDSLDSDKSYHPSPYRTEMDRKKSDQESAQALAAENKKLAEELGKMRSRASTEDVRVGTLLNMWPFFFCNYEYFGHLVEIKSGRSAVRGRRLGQQT